MFLGIFGGYIACVYGGFSTSGEFIQGIQLDFTPFHVTYAFIKTAFFFIHSCNNSFISWIFYDWRSFRSWKG